MALSTSVGNGQYVAAENHVACSGRYRKAAAKRAVVIHAGRGQTALGSLPPDSITTALAETGAPVMYADYVDGKTWGNDTVQSRIGSLWSYSQTAWGAKTDKVCLYGSSMGGCCVLNWAHANPTQVACIALLIPAVDVGDIYDNNRTQTPLGFSAVTDIDTAYGGTGSYTGTVRSTHNPAVVAGSFAGIPTMIWYSGDDPVCVPATQTAFATAAGCTAINVGNHGHSGGNQPVNINQIVNFLGTYV